MDNCSTSYSGYVNVLNLQQIENIDIGDLLVVSSDENTYAIDFENIILPIENTTFGSILTSHSNNIEINNTSIASLCTFATAGISAAIKGVIDLNNEVHEKPVIDINPTVAVAPINNGEIDTRDEILYALSSVIPCVPWSTKQVQKFSTQRIPYYTGDTNQPISDRSRWTTITGLSCQLSRSTLKSKVLVECKLQVGFNWNDIPYEYLGNSKSLTFVPFSTGLFRIVRNNTVVGGSTISFDEGGTVHGAVMSRVKEWGTYRTINYTKVDEKAISTYRIPWRYEDGSVKVSPEPDIDRVIIAKDYYLQEQNITRVTYDSDNLATIHFEYLDDLKKVEENVLNYSIQACCTTYEHNMVINRMRIVDDEVTYGGSSTLTVTELI